MPPDDNLSNRNAAVPSDLNPAKPWQITLMGFGLVIVSLSLAYLLLRLWPAGLKPEASGSELQMIYLWSGKRLGFEVSNDVRLILLVMVAGGLGSFIHTATSFGDFVGNQTLSRSWIWWYLLRPFIGMILAVVFYLVIRGGFLSAGTEAGSVNPFGIAALAGLVGMFSKQASDKLNEVFNTLFKTAPGAGDSKRKDNLTNPLPTISDIEPKSVEPLTKNLIIKVRGTGFVKGASIRVNGTNRETEFVDETQLVATLMDDDVKESGELKLTVFNPPPGGGVSVPIKLNIGPNP
jgi:hypothetical protein